MVGERAGRLRALDGRGRGAPGRRLHGVQRREVLAFTLLVMVTPSTRGPYLAVGRRVPRAPDRRHSPGRGLHADVDADNLDGRPLAGDVGREEELRLRVKRPSSWLFD